MKLAKDNIKERENFVREAVKADPTVTGDRLQELLAQHFGMKMRGMRLYQLKNEALDLIRRRL